MYTGDQIYISQSRLLSYFKLLLQDDCHTLNCPFGSTAFYGKCENVAMKTSGLGVTVNYNLKVVPRSGHITLEKIFNYGKNAFGELIEAALTSANGDIGANCPTCSNRITSTEGQQTDVTELILTRQLHTTSGCQLQSLYQVATEILGKQISLAVDGDNFTLLIMLEKRLLTDIQSLSNIYWKETRICVPVYALTKEKICPEVEINVDILEQKLGMKAGTILRASNNPTNASMATVCWEDYLSAMSQVHPASSNGKHGVEVYIMALCFISSYAFLTVYVF